VQVDSFGKKLNGHVWVMESVEDKAAKLREEGSTRSIALEDHSAAEVLLRFNSPAGRT